MLLSVKNLSTEFPVKKGIIRAVEDVSFDLDIGQTLAIVGESGSGKSVTGLSIMGLLSDAGHVSGGSMIFDGKDLRKLSQKEYRALRGNDMAMIFQEPMTSLNPVYRVGDQIVEAIRAHKKMKRRDARALTIELLHRVGIPSPAQRVRDYPHQMSGGMRQRVMIAMALACNPKLLIADEPTTALDVTIQAQILDLIRRLREETTMAVLLITHDLGVVSETADYVVVMYCGQVVESAEVRSLFASPLHPYTLGLLKSIPSLDDDDVEEGSSGDVSGGGASGGASGDADASGGASGGGASGAAGVSGGASGDADASGGASGAAGVSGGASGGGAVSGGASGAGAASGGGAVSGGASGGSASAGAGAVGTGERQRLYTIRGSVPDPLEMPPGCHFSDRCDQCFDRCRAEAPQLIQVGDHKVRCFLYEEADASSKEQPR